MMNARFSGRSRQKALARCVVIGILLALVFVPQARQWLADNAGPDVIVSTDQTQQQPQQQRQPGSKKEPESGRNPPGELKEIRPNVLQSAAGLLYLSGSADGHRLRHVLQHAEDDETRRIHGVFEGDQNEIVALIDEAFVRSQQGGRDVRRRTEGERTVLTVRFDRRIGYVGGEEGKHSSHPECRCLRLVVEDGNVVVTAYPTRSL